MSSRLRCTWPTHDFKVTSRILVWFSGLGIELLQLESPVSILAFYSSILPNSLQTTVAMNATTKAVLFLKLDVVDVRCGLPRLVWTVMDKKEATVTLEFMAVGISEADVNAGMQLHFFFSLI